MKPNNFTIGAALLLTVSCNHQESIHKYNRSLIDYCNVSSSYLVDYNFMKLRAYYNENKEKYGDAHAQSLKAWKLNERFQLYSDSVLESEKLDYDRIYEVFITSVDSMICHVTDPYYFQRSENDLSFLKQHEGIDKTTVLLFKNFSNTLCNDIILFNIADMGGCGWRFSEVQLAQESDHTISLSDNFIQQTENRIIDITSFTKDGKPTDLKARAKNTFEFGQIEFDSLPPGEYTINGNVLSLSYSSYVRKQPFEYRFDVP